MDPNVLISSGLGAIFVSVIIQGLKKANWFPWLTVETARLNRSVAMVMACLFSFGIHATYHGGEDGTLIITGLTLANLKAFASHAFSQFLAQHVAYKGFVVPTELQAAGVNLLKQILAQQGGTPNGPPKVP